MELWLDVMMINATRYQYLEVVSIPDFQYGEKNQIDAQRSTQARLFNLKVALMPEFSKYPLDTGSPTHAQCLNFKVGSMAGTKTTIVWRRRPTRSLRIEFGSGMGSSASGQKASSGTSKFLLITVLYSKRWMKFRFIVPFCILYILMIHTCLHIGLKSSIFL